MPYVNLGVKNMWINHTVKCGKQNCEERVTLKKVKQNGGFCEKHYCELELCKVKNAT